MPCTTLLAGKLATYDGSTFAARNEDSGAGAFTPKKFVTVHPEEQPRHYKSVISHVEIELPENPMRYTAMPNALPGEGIWGAAGVNEANVSMTATETITSNERVLSADPLVRLIKAQGDQPEVPGGIGEEDMVTITLPYIRSAREGVLRLGKLLEQYGTYEMNGIAFQDVNEVWWLETIGGHHWIARRVPDNAYVIMPNQFGIDSFDLEDAFGEQKEHLCSADLREFIRDNFLDLSMNGSEFNARDAFGSHSDSDHSYNTPRAWFMARYLNPKTFRWDGPDADYTPESDDIPWCLVPEKKITVEDAKYVLSAHYNGTQYDPYRKYGDLSERGKYRPIGINRNNFLSLVQIRPYVPAENAAVEWIAYGSNAFNAFVPFYANIDDTPEYLANTASTVTTESFYWANRIIAAMADAHFDLCKAHIERYSSAVAAKGHWYIKQHDKAVMSGQGCPETKADPAAEPALKPGTREEINREIAAFLKEETDKVLANVLQEASCAMKNGYSRSDA